MINTEEQETRDHCNSGHEEEEKDKDFLGVDKHVHKFQQSFLEDFDSEDDVQQSKDVKESDFENLELD